MPTVGIFHRNFWKARSNPILPPGAARIWSYPAWQTSVISAGFGALQVWWERLVWWWTIDRRIARLTAEQVLVLERVLTTMESAWWAEAGARVRVCATTPKFHQPAQWVEYGRAIKADMGQAQNVFRHVRIVHELHQHARETDQPLTNPDAHLVTELAYQGFSALGRDGRRILHH